MKVGYTLIVWLMAVCFLQASPDTFALQVLTTVEAVEIDGLLDEPIWQRAEKNSEFWQWFPADSIHAQARTELYMARDEKYLYVGAICYTAGDDFVISSLRRDYRAGGNDNISLMFDPFNDRRNAFLFGMNAYGVKREALVTDGGRGPDSFNTAWDNRWEGATTNYEDRYVCEFAIPFTTLRYIEGGQKWSFNCYRFDTQHNEWSVWTHIPQNQQFFRLGFMGDLHWEDPLDKTGRNLVIIPYASGGSGKDHEAGTGATTIREVGADAKVAVTPGLNLDLTLNPDFSQVEVDQQLTNLTRFELFLPERRQFFLENSDLFGSFGSERINPFFSRRIGIATDTASGLTVQNRIWAGARLSGKITDDVRIGVLNMQAADDRSNGLPSYNYGVFAVQKAIQNRSSLGAIFVNKQHFSKHRFSETTTSYNRVIGLDYNFLSKNNNWDGRIFYHRSFSEDQQSDPFSHGFLVNYYQRNVEASWRHSYVGEGYDAEVGFVPRTGFFSINPEIALLLYGRRAESKLVNHGPGIELDALWKPGFGQTDSELTLFWNFRFAGNQRGRIFIERNFIHLFDDFDPSRTGAEPLPGNADYRYTLAGLSYSTDQRKKLNHRFIALAGEFFNGEIMRLSGTSSYRFQPYGNVALSYSYNRIMLPEPYATENLLLVGPRVDITFSKKIFLTTLVQYNNQIDNLNINARLQWRYKPVSDFYLVYTDNYDTQHFGVRNRSLVAKVTYWLNA